MATALQTPTHLTGPYIPDPKATHAQWLCESLCATRHYARELSATSAAGGWTIGAAADVRRFASVCTPTENAEQCMDFALFPAFDFELQLTAEEAQWLVQPPAFAPCAYQPPAPVTASRPSAPAKPAVLRRAATSLGVAGRRLARTASGSVQRLCSSLAAATCLSPRRAPAAERFTPGGEGWTKTHINWS